MQIQSFLAISRAAHRFVVVLSCATLFSSPLKAAEPAPLPEHTPWNLKSLQEAPKFSWHDRTGKVHSLFYEAEPYQGKPTRVFAYYASPATLGIERSGKEKRYPAVVLVHGGYGHAFSNWAELYAKRGYAAIAMSLGGQGPDAKTRMPDAGPPQNDTVVFERPEIPDKNHWSYHAVADVILAHSLIRSFDEVDPDRTGIIGISWGGYLTCIVAGLDHRFKAALPMYGCGFLHENSFWKYKFDRYMSPEWRAKWIRLYDPSSYVGSATMPMFFLNGSNDQFYPLDSHAKTYRLVHAPKNIRIEPKMPHGHRFDVKECFLFFDHHLKGEPALAKVASLNVGNGRLVAEVASPVKIVSAELHYTTGPHVENKQREWTDRPLRIEGNKITGDAPPAEATAWYVTVVDARTASVSSEVAVRD